MTESSDTKNWKDDAVYDVSSLFSPNHHVVNFANTPLPGFGINIIKRWGDLELYPMEDTSVEDEVSLNMSESSNTENWEDDADYDVSPLFCVRPNHYVGQLLRNTPWPTFGIKGLDDMVGDMSEETFDEDENYYGIILFSNGDRYDGVLNTFFFVSCLPHGKGKYTWAANDTEYNGEWIYGKMQGRGTETYLSGDVYEGEWQNNQKNGEGIATYNTGGRYEGEWKNGKKDGKGISTFANGAVYEGTYKNGKKNGRGKETYASGAVYEGDYKDGQKHGKGKFTWPNGDAYEGDFKDGKMTGQGTKTYLGAVYVGEFEQAKYNGQGKLTIDGKVFEGKWKNNSLWVKMLSKNGTIFHSNEPAFEISKELQAFNCPITQDIMNDPVTCMDGHTYEKEAIQRWFAKHDTSPLTGAKLPSKHLIPNFALKSAINELKSAIDEAHST